MDKKIERLISGMTLQEKIAQLTQEWTSNERMDELIDLASKGELGSCILTDTAWAGNSEQEDLYLDKLNEIQRAAVEKSRLGIPVIYGRDVIHGYKTIFPIPLAQAATWDYELIKDAASIMSKEASLDGVHWTFAPMLDICCDPRWGRIIECPGEDPYIGAMFAKASVDGIQGKDMSENGKIAACAKHFVGYGAPQGGRDKDVCEWSDYTLRNKAIPAFESAIDNGVATVMASFNEIGGQPVTASKYYLNQILRRELGFEGFVISDWAAVEKLKYQGVSDTDLTSAYLAINAGVDMDMADGIYKNNIESLINDGLVSMDTIDEAVRRVLRIKFKLGLFENPYFNVEDSLDGFMTKEALQKAEEVSLHSMVLLKNDDVLPLKKGEYITVGGPMAEEKASLLGSWHSGGRPEDVVSLAEGIKQVNGEEFTFVRAGGEEFMYRYVNYTDICVVALGEGDFVTGEGQTLSKIEISKSQINCVKYAKEHGKKVIAVIFAGRPLAITEIMPYCDAILWAWHGGTMCGLAAAKIIYGDFNPCAKLPVTLPRSTGQIPIYYNHNRNEANFNGYYSNEITYRDILSTPAFVFGYGLSYTKFEYSGFEYTFNKKLNKAQISFRIKNTGDYPGYEIAQCYVNDIVASMSRPIKELRAYEKVFLEKGEEKEVVFYLDKQSLSFYDKNGMKTFEKGDFKIEIGKNCNDIVCEMICKIDFD